MSQPPSVFRKAQAECMPSFNSPVVFFSSNVRVSSPAMIRLISSMPNPYGHNKNDAFTTALPIQTTMTRQYASIQ